MKLRSLSYAVAMLLTIPPSSVIAQNIAVVGTGNGGGNSTGTVLNEAGRYTVEQYDRNLIEKMAGEHMKDRQDQDKAFIVDTIKLIEEELNQLVTLLNGSTGLVKTSVNAIGKGEFVSLLDYLSLTQEVVAQKNMIENRIAGLFLMPGALQSKEVIQSSDSIEVNLPAPFKVELEKIQDFYAVQIDKATAQVDSLQFPLILPDGSMEVVTGIDYMPDKPVFSAEKLNEMREAALDDARIKTKDQQKIDEMNLMTLSGMRDLMRIFGQDKDYRFELNEDGRDINLERLAEIFWVRDLLRSVYGLPLGAPAVNYELETAHWDFFASSSRLRFLGEFIHNEGDLSKFQDRATAALKTAESRSQEVFGEGVDLLDRIMSGVEFVKGQSKQAEINVFVLKLLERDIRHEMYMTRPGGQTKMRIAYRELYYPNDKVKNEIRAKAKLWLTGGDSSDARSLLIKEGTTQGALRVAVAGLDSIIDSLNQAQKRLAALEALRANNETAQEVLDDLDSL